MEIDEDKKAKKKEQERKNKLKQKKNDAKPKPPTTIEGALQAVCSFISSHSNIHIIIANMYNVTV